MKGSVNLQTVLIVAAAIFTIIAFNPGFFPASLTDPGRLPNPESGYVKAVNYAPVIDATGSCSTVCDSKGETCSFLAVNNIPDISKLDTDKSTVSYDGKRTSLGWDQYDSDTWEFGSTSGASIDYSTHPSARCTVYYHLEFKTAESSPVTSGGSPASGQTTGCGAACNGQVSEFRIPLVSDFIDWLLSLFKG